MLRYRERERERVNNSLRNFNFCPIKIAVLLFCAVFLFFGLAIPKAFAINAPSDISGLQLWLDTSQSNSLYKDAAKTQPATLESDKIAVWADLSGNGYDATNTNATNQPLLTLNKDGGYAGVKFLTSNVLLNFGNPDVLNFGNAGSFTIFIVYNRTSSASSYYNLLHKGTVVDSNRAYWLIRQSDYYSVVNFLHSKSPSSSNAIGANVFAYSFNPIDSSSGYEYSYMNGVANWYDSAALPTWTTAGTWNIGGDGTFSLGGYMQAVYIYNRELSATEMRSVNQYISDRFSVAITAPSTTQTMIIYDGNSITTGQDTSGTRRFSQYIYNSQSTKIPYINLGVSGMGTTQMNAAAPTRIDPLYISSITNNILVGWEGTNDIKGGTNGTSAYNNLVTYYTARKAVGWKNIAVSVLPRSASQGPAPFEVERQSANSLLRTNFTTDPEEALVDMGNDPNMGQPGQAESTTYYVDGTHPNDAGYAIIASRIGPAIDALINPLTSLTSISTSTTSTSATIGWTSNASSSSIVDFDLTSNYSTSTAEIDNASTTRKLSHSVTVSGLTSCALYHYRARSNRLSTTTDLVYLKNGTASSTDSTFITSGCTGNAAVATSTSNTITTASGGSLSLGTTTISVPASFTATSSSANFQVKQLDPTAFFASASTPMGKNKVGNYVVNLKALTDATTTLSTFSQPISVTMSYSPSDVTNLIESSLIIYRYDGASWNALSCSAVNTSAHTVTCQTNNFSDFSLFGDSDTTPPTPGTISFSNVTTTSITATTTGASDDIALAAQPFRYHNVTTNSYSAATSTAITFTGLTPNTSYTFEVGVVDAAGNWATSTQQATTTLILYHTITATAGSHGSISHSPSIAVADGTNQSFTITPDSGYTVATLTIDSSLVATSTTHTFSNVTADHIIAVTFVDTTAPAVTMTAPSDLATVSGSSVTISADASDNGAVVGVQFKLDTNTLIGSEVTTPPYNITWNSNDVADGAHTLIAVARDNSGNYATSTAVNITVSNTVTVVTPPVATVSHSSSGQYSRTFFQPVQPTTPSVLPTISTLPTFTRSLSPKSTSSDIKLLQIYLNTHGFVVAKAGDGSLGHETNYFGSATKAALIKFQKANGILPATGDFGPRTRALLNNFSATTQPATINANVSSFTRDLEKGMTGEDVKTLQIYLNMKGFPVASSGAGSLGLETTLFGLGTKAALIKFQKANGITPAIGYFGAKTQQYIASH